MNLSGMEIHEQEKIGWLSALPAGLCDKGGDVLLHLGAFALRTGNFGCSMIGNALHQSKFFVAVSAFILVGRHIPPPCFLIIWFQTKRVFNTSLSSLMNQNILSRDDLEIGEFP
jgi:hypothetical protein